MCGFESDFVPECKSKSTSGCFKKHAGMFGLKCFIIIFFLCLILEDFKKGIILTIHD